MGIYRFWRDLGYTVAASVFDVLTLILDNVVYVFFLVFILMVLSNRIVVIYLDNDMPYVRFDLAIRMVNEYSYFNFC